MNGIIINSGDVLLPVQCKATTYTETEMSSFWWNFHHWLHWKLSKWQLPVQPVIKISSKWRHFRFSVGHYCLIVNLIPNRNVGNFLSKRQNGSFREMHLKCRLWNVSHFVQPQCDIETINSMYLNEWAPVGRLVVMGQANMDAIIGVC